jgi:hypothetical protein
MRPRALAQGPAQLSFVQQGSESKIPRKPEAPGGAMESLSHWVNEVPQGSMRVPGGTHATSWCRDSYHLAFTCQEFKMKLAALSIVALLAAAPAFAQSVTDSDKASSDMNATSSTMVTPPAENPNVDAQTAAADTARQDMYKHKLDAAKSQAKADSAIADRDAAEAQADQDRDNKNVAQGKYPQ